jgi:hypothetical protein
MVHVFTLNGADSGVKDRERGSWQVLSWIQQMGSMARVRVRGTMTDRSVGAREEG